MRSIFVTVVCTLYMAFACAQQSWLHATTPPVSGVYSRHFQQLFSAMRNQAGLAYITTFTAGAVSERRFMLDALSLHEVSAALPVRTGAVGLNLQQSGYSVYTQQSLGLGYGMRLGERCAIGIQGDYLAVRDAYKHAGTITCEAGALLQLTPKLYAGVHAFNPLNQRLGKDPVDADYTVGVGYEVSTDCLLAVSVEQEGSEAPATTFSGAYKLPAGLLLQLALCTDPSFSSVGLGITLQKLYICCTAAWHPQLGITPGLALSWCKN
jgi:hypothetical protein